MGAGGTSVTSANSVLFSYDEKAFKRSTKLITKLIRPQRVPNTRIT